MHIDQARVESILRADHFYYGGRDIPIRRDSRWYPGVSNLIAQELLPTMKVLDVGCGNGAMLLELSSRYHSGVGIDIDPEHIQMAENARRKEGIKNVGFLLLDYPREIARLQPESFDMVISIHGPLGDTAEEVQAAHQLLCPDGLLFCSEIGELQDKEVEDVFGDDSRSKERIRRVDEVRVLVERNGFDVRLAADLFSKWNHPDVYAWLQYQCNIWAWLGTPLPECDDPRIALFAERNTNAVGEIETTHHVAWIAGVKR